MSPRDRREWAAHAIELLQRAMLDLAWFAATEGKTDERTLMPEDRLRYTADAIVSAEKAVRFIKGEKVTFP